MKELDNIAELVDDYEQELARITAIPLLQSPPVNDAPKSTKKKASNAQKSTKKTRGRPRKIPANA